LISTYVYEPTKTAQEQSVKSLDYADNFSDGQNRNTFAYPTKLTDPDGYTLGVWYNYQTGAEFKRQTPQPNTDQNVAGPTVSHYYDEGGRLTKLVNNVNGAYTEWVYAPSLTLVQSFTTVADNSLPAQNQNLRAYSAMVLDGAGRVRGTARGLPDIAGGYAGQRLLRNNMGRVEYQSNPTQMTTANNVWTPAGDDANNGVWRYVRQEYDWNGRPTVTTNQDGSQKVLDYTGCSCTGSDTVTLRDEVGRLRKTYNDPLGRPYKTEDLYTDGVTVYRTVRNDFNALDQVRAVTEQAGTNGASQTMTTDYDGYGRVWKTKAPEANAPQVFEYFNDGHKKKLTDARGASATYGYNKRGLLTSIDYSAPQGVADTPDVGFGYDAAGNRAWMTDGLGRVDYSYDALSRLEWESRQFTLVSNPNSADHRYKLSYQYTLDGQPKSITDPFGMRVDYAYDTEGRLTGVGGSPSFNGITQYTSDMKYRAWGAYKSMNYGDGLTVQFSYNARLNPSDYDLRDAGGARQMSVSYQYYNDGRVSFVDDLREDRFDRLYQYDDFARLTKAESGYKARQAPYPGNNSQNGPYNHYYGYDVFDNLTSRTGAYWYKESGENYGATYVNNRNQNTGWLYDADGRLTQSVVQGSSGTYNNTYTYDAAGQRTDAGRYDGDGLQIKSADGLLCYVRSTVLGGKVISEVWSE
ncbi:MAG TPA: hypothetical protein VNZ44_07425, partial [Pyrinomonadaceae bacterium]|nr:hypothetical protein [Pyrinomonadaceae bacterium]